MHPGTVATCSQKEIGAVEKISLETGDWRLGV